MRSWVRVNPETGRLTLRWKERFPDGPAFERELTPLERFLWWLYMRKPSP